MKRPVVSPMLKFVELEIGGQTYRLAWTFAAIKAAERVTGLKLLIENFPRRENGELELSASQLSGLFYAALLPAQPKITEAEADALLDQISVSEVLDALIAARRDSAPDPTPAAGALKAGGGAPEDSATTKPGTAAGPLPESSLDSRMPNFSA
jgi:hypothetical protein